MDAYSWFMVGFIAGVWSGLVVVIFILKMED